MKKGILICFIGIDGSGKTTQAGILTNALLMQGIKTKYVWNGFEPLLANPFIALARILFLCRENMFVNYKSYLNRKTKLFRNRPLFAIYRYLVLGDYLLQSLWKIRLPLRQGKVVICDRYVYDVVGFLATDGSYSEEYVRRSLKRFFDLFPKPELTFLIDLPEEVAYRRKDDIPSLSHLTDRRNMYLSMVKYEEITVLDGTSEPLKLAELIQQKIVDSFSP